MNIYTITMMENLDDGFDRCFGYFTDLDIARNSLINNMTDLHETIYDYAVIERFDEGLYPAAFDRWFYKYDDFKDMYFEIDTPKELKNVLNFAIG